LTVFALCGAIGLQWIALQSVAWAAMLVDHAKCAPLRQAIAQTFDGAHPCALCHAVAKGKSAQKKSELQSPGPKIDLICPPRARALLASFVPFRYATPDFFFAESRPTPPVPPPRSFLS
jgi:hypothetical protein